MTNCSDLYGPYPGPGLPQRAAACLLPCRTAGTNGMALLRALPTAPQGHRAAKQSGQGLLWPPCLVASPGYPDSQALAFFPDRFYSKSQSWVAPSFLCLTSVLSLTT